MCLLRGTSWIFKYISSIFDFTVLDIHDRPPVMNHTVDTSWKQLLLKHSWSILASTLYRLHSAPALSAFHLWHSTEQRLTVPRFCSCPLRIHELYHKPSHNLRKTTAASAVGKRISYTQQLPTFTSTPVDAQTWHWSRNDAQIMKLSTATHFRNNTCFVWLIYRKR